MSSTLSYVDSVLAEDLPSLGASDGDRVPFVPKTQGTLAVDYQRPLGIGQGFVSVDAQYVAKRDTSLIDSQNHPLASYTAVGLRLGFRTERYELQAFAENLTDERADILRTRFGFGSVDAIRPGVIQTVTLRPRTIGFQGRVRF